MENACTIRMLKIESFSTTASKTSDDCIRSKWNVGGYEWEILIYPAHEPFYPHDCTPWVVLELAFLSESLTSGSWANLSFQLIHPSGRVKKPVEEKTVTRIFHRPQERSKLLKILPRDDLVTYGYLKDDILTMQFAVTVLKELPPAPTIPAEVIPLPSRNLHKHLGELLHSEARSDVTFLVSDKSFPAHKLLLAARSPVFMAEFFGDMKEKRSRRVVVKDMEAAIFKAMLHFIYTDTVPELDQPLEVVATMAQRLLAAADRYGLEDLRMNCELKLSGGITIDTAASTLALAEQHNGPLLKQLCIDFILSSSAVLDAVLVTEGYKHLEVSCPSVLADLIKSALWRNN